MELKINDILEKIKERNVFGKIKRFKYLPYDLDFAMQVVVAIGKERNKKFRTDEENRFTYGNMIRWVNADPDFKCLCPETRKIIPGRLDAGIYIAGGTGTGKSWALEIMSAFCLIDNIQVMTGKTQRCLHWKNFRTDEICDVYTNTGTIEKFKKMPVLGIQDAGTDSEPTESLYMGNRIDVIKQLLEYRGDQSDQLTLITSNIPISHQRLTDRYGVRVSSRLNEMCNYFEITGIDRRKI